MTQDSDPRAWYFDVRFRAEEEVGEWPEEFVIVTGYATTGEVWPEERNYEADVRLRGELMAMGRWHVRLTGYSPVSGHAEPGWAVMLSAAEGEALGRRYAQDAIYVVRGDALSVRYCADGREESVGGWRARVDG
jgi:hypothetical protein